MNGSGLQKLQTASVTLLCSFRSSSPPSKSASPQVFTVCTGDAHAAQGNNSWQAAPPCRFRQQKDECFQTQHESMQLRSMLFHREYPASQPAAFMPFSPFLSVCFHCCCCVFSNLLMINGTTSSGLICSTAANSSLMSFSAVFKTCSSAVRRWRWRSLSVCCRE